MWDTDVKAAIQDITANYADVVYAVEVFNEPDQQLNNTAFNTDPLVQGSTYNDRINWLWTHTVQEIRAINPSLKLMGPNYLSYLPQSTAADQTKMQAFLQNAIATGTSPDIIGWHSLLTNNPEDIGASLSNYRVLEQQLNVPNAPLPVSIDEYGVNDGTFEGVPGHVVRYWAEMERVGIDFGGTGTYTNYSQLGNTLRFPWMVGEKTMLPNGGWYMLRWYNQMAGDYVPVTTTGTYDGVASYDASKKTVTLLLGGSNETADVHFQGLSSVGLTGQVRLRVEQTVWTVDPNQGDTTIERGGDPETGTFDIVDELVSASGGNLTIPIHNLEQNNGYRIIISPAAAAPAYPTKYEAEDAILKKGKIETGNNLASNEKFVDGLTESGSSATFEVSVKSAGIYNMQVRFATTSDSAVQSVSVNGRSQGELDYAQTQAPAKQFAFTTKLLALNAGLNEVTLKREAGSVSLDYIDVRPDEHRYQAAYAFVGDSTLYSYLDEYILSDYVGGINNYDSYVEFNINAPKNGTYNLNISYANGISGADAVDDLYVNGAGEPSVLLPYTGSFTGGVDPRTAEKIVTIPVTLNEGLNTVRLQKDSNYAELDYVTLTLQ